MAWSNHGRHHRSLCREGSAGPPGAVERQRGLSGAGWGGGGSRPGAGDVFWVRGCVCACMGGVHRCAPPGSAGLPPLSKESGGQNVADGSRPPLRGGGRRGWGLGTPPVGSHLAWPHPGPRRRAAAPGGISPAWLGSAPSCGAQHRLLQSSPKPPGTPARCQAAGRSGGGAGGSRVPPQNPLTAV